MRSAAVLCVCVLAIPWKQPTKNPGPQVQGGARLRCLCVSARTVIKNRCEDAIAVECGRVGFAQTRAWRLLSLSPGAELGFNAREESAAGVRKSRNYFKITKTHSNTQQHPERCAGVCRPRKNPIWSLKAGRQAGRHERSRRSFRRSFRTPCSMEEEEEEEEALELERGAGGAPFFGKREREEKNGKAMWFFFSFLVSGMGQREPYPPAPCAKRKKGKGRFF